MAAEEDKKFDAVLGGFLVRGLRIRAGELHCPESDTLAAYHERSLLPEEMNSWKEHIVGCARCQAILAELEATDSVPLVSEKEEVPQLAAAPAAGVAERMPPRKEAPVTLPGKSRVTPISRGVRWQWLAPAGALAAGLLVWIAWHENRPLQEKPSPEIKTAKLEPPATLPPSVTGADREAASAEEVARLSKDQTAVVGGIPAKPALEAKSLKQFEKSDSRGRVAGPKLHADKEAGARADAPGDSLSAADRVQNQSSQDAKAALAAPASETGQVQTRTANSQPQNQQAQQNLQAQQNQLNEQGISGPNPSRHAELSKKTKSESAALHRAAPPAAPPLPPPVAAFSDGAALRMAGGINPSVIAAPDKKTLWRAGHAGMIEFSADGGASWSRQISNRLADLTAGSAPSDKVCWIVGRAGTILLTSDAGAHWATIYSPLDEDLGGVRATDALRATIWNVASTKIFETSDGGLTWKPSASR